MDDKGRAAELHDLLQRLDLTHADSRAGLGALLREVADVVTRPARAAMLLQSGRAPVTTVYNGATTAGLDDVGVACGD
ncbi:MAG: hypothetical protein ACRED4_04495 [Brevundimonas sp.]